MNIAMQGNSISYVWEKAMVAVNCLASGTGSFESRLHDAYTSTLMRLDHHVHPQEFEDQLTWILEMCQRYLSPGGNRMNPIPDSERKRIVESLIHILTETSRMQVQVKA